MIRRDWVDGYQKNGGLLKRPCGEMWSCLNLQLSFELKPELSYSPSFVKMGVQTSSTASAACRSPVDGGGSFTAFSSLSPQ